MSTAPKTADLKLQTGPSGNGRVLRFTGCWEKDAAKMGLQETLAGMKAAGRGTFTCDGEGLVSWDSSLLVVAVKLKKLCGELSAELDLSGLPEGVGRLVELATAVPDRTQSDSHGQRPGLVARLGSLVLAWTEAVVDHVRFLGEVALALGRFVAGRAQLQFADILASVEDSGAKAFPIVGLIALLMGIILAFVGAVQLRMFGAEIFVADLVAIGIVRSLGAIMTGIVMAGRTGASYAARIGSMQVNEEVDAFTTMGISPIDFLVVPRLVGLVLMMPLLCVYADVIGLLGGMMVGVGLLGLSPALYIQRTREALGLNHFLLGIVMSIVFGFLVAFFGCYKGMRCGRSAQSVGSAVTAAVVSGIISIVVATAVITILADILGV